MLSRLGLAGNLEAAALLECAAGGDMAAALERLDGLYANGKEMTALCGELSALARDLLVRKTAPRGGAALMTGGFDGETLKKLSGRFDVPRLVQMLARLQKTAADLARSANRRTDMELCLAALCDPALDPSPAGLAARVARLEQGGIPAPAPREAPAPEQVRAAASKRGAPTPVDEVPWEEPPLPDEPPPREENAWEGPPNRDIPPEPASKTEPVRAVLPAPDPEPAPPPPAEEPPAPVPKAPGWPGWPAFRDRLKGVLDESDYSMIGNPAMAEGRFDGKRLTLWAANDFLKDMISRPELLRPMAELCRTLTGTAQAVEVRVGQAPPETAAAPAPADPPGEDPLEAFLAQNSGNIIVE